MKAYHARGRHAMTADEFLDIRDVRCFLLTFDNLEQ